MQCSGCQNPTGWFENKKGEQVEWRLIAEQGIGVDAVGYNKH